MTQLDLFTTDDTEWTGAFKAYARAHGRTPRDQQEHDRIVYHGGVNVPFVAWMGERWAEYETIHPRRSDLAPRDVEGFHTWIEGWQA